MSSDTTIQLEEWNEESWTYAYSMEISDGLIYMYMTDTPSEDGEVSTGWLCEANPQNRTFRELPIAFPAPPEYGQMQAEDGWLYFVADNSSPETFGGTEFSDVLLRASLEDYHLERISDENIEAFFVCGDTAFCMKDGEAVQYSISQSLGIWDSNSTPYHLADLEAAVASIQMTTKSAAKARASPKSMPRIRPPTTVEEYKSPVPKRSKKRQ